MSNYNNRNNATTLRGVRTLVSTNQGKQTPMFQWSIYTPRPNERQQLSKSPSTGTREKVRTYLQGRYRRTVSRHDVRV